MSAEPVTQPCVTLEGEAQRLRDHVATLVGNAAPISVDLMVANLRRMQAELMAPKGCDNLTLTLRGAPEDNEPYGVSVYWGGTDYRFEVGYGATPQAALIALAAKLPKPSALRDQAAKLLAEAEKLENRAST